MNIKSESSIDSPTLSSLNTKNSDSIIQGKTSETNINKENIETNDWFNQHPKQSSGYQGGNPFLSGYNYRKNITIDNTKVSADLTNFPVLIDLYDSDLQNHARADGWDILFLDASSETKVAHEIELYDAAYNSTHAHMVAWVSANISSSSPDTVLSMYFDNPIIGNMQNPEGVWDDNYAGVWHLSEDPTETILDSTGYDNDGASQGSMSSDNLVDAQIGKGIDFDGINDLISISDDTSLDITGDITVQCWFICRDTSSEPDIITKGEWDESYSLYIGNRIVFCLNSNEYYANSQASNNTMFFALCTRSGNTWTIYIDGVNDRSGTYSNAINVTDTALTFSTSGYPFNGTIDEVRISNTARSAEWIETEFNNQGNPSNFHTVGTLETSPITDEWPNPLFRYRKNLTIAASKVSGSGFLTNFPVLIDITDSDLKSGEVQADGDDILFTDENGVKLAYEMESFIQTSSDGHLRAWVKIPSVSAITNTNFTMYYGNNAIGSQEDSTAVWSDYRGVWHLGESSGNALDSTIYSTNGVPEGGYTQGVTGKIGESYEFDGNDGGVEFGDPVDDHLDGGIGDWVFSCWAYIDAATSGTQDILRKGGYIGEGGYHLDINSAMEIEAEISDVVEKEDTSRTSIPTGTWLYLVGVVDRTSDRLIMYVNGSEIASKDISIIGSISTNYNFRISDPGQSVDGKIDEVHIGAHYHSSDWIATEYMNQYDPENFCWAGTKESLFADGYESQDLSNWDSIDASGTGSYSAENTIAKYESYSMNFSIGDGGNGDGVSAIKLMDEPVNGKNYLQGWYM